MSFHFITDEAIAEIIECWMVDVKMTHSPASDKARKGIIKMYTYESDLYKAINTASCFHNETKIQTLGPYVWLLYCSLTFPPTSNAEDRKELFSGEIKEEQTGKIYKTMILYRGLGLPQNAIDTYKKMSETGDYLLFNGFTSTSISREKALGFAYKTENDGKVPCLFVLENYFDQGVYLYNQDYTAFPAEREVLIA